MIFTHNVFFITEDEAKGQRERTGDKYIDHQLPHFQSADGTTFWGKSGFSVAKEVWWSSEIEPKPNGTATDTAEPDPKGST